MSTPTDGPVDPYHRFWEQYAVVQASHRALIPPVEYEVEPPEATPGSGVAPRYVHEARAVLVRTADLEQVQLHTDAPVQDVPGLPSLRKLMLREGMHVPTEVDRLNQAVHGQSEHSDQPAPPMTSPNHLVTITPVNLCPAGEPVPVPPETKLWPYPQPAQCGTPHAPGHGVSILVIDTGLQADLMAEEPLLDGVQAISGESPRVPVDPDTDLIKEYAGHGTFIAGVIRTVAPGADVTVSSALQNAGALDEAALSSTILALLEAIGWPDIISLSAGTASHRQRGLISLDPLLEEIDKHPGTILVAAAGNDGNTEKFWPACSDHPGVLSVGALRHDGTGRACFTNYGDWIQVYARGEYIVNVFRHGTYGYKHESTDVCRYHNPELYHPCGCINPVTTLGEEVTFDGLASWSGTSFATPIVAGMIAAYMTETGMSDARAAASDLLSQRATTIVESVDNIKLLALG